MGWAALQLNPQLKESVCSVHGSMPVALPLRRRILRAELWALLQAWLLQGLDRTSSLTARRASRHESGRQRQCRLEPGVRATGAL